MKRVSYRTKKGETVTTFKEEEPEIIYVALDLSKANGELVMKALYNLDSVVVQSTKDRHRLCLLHKTTKDSVLTAIVNILAYINDRIIHSNQYITLEKSSFDELLRSVQEPQQQELYVDYIIRLYDTPSYQQRSNSR